MQGPALWRSGFIARTPLWGAATASILVHAALIGSVLALVLAKSRLRPTESGIIFVTVTTVGSGLGTSAASSFASSGGHHKDLGKSPHNSRHAHHAVPQVATLLRVPQSTPSPVDASTNMNSSEPGFAKVDAPNSAGLSQVNGRNAVGSQTGGTLGESSIGSVSGAVVYWAPILLSKVVPAYPENARRLGIEGEVVLQFVVDRSGLVEPEIQVVASLPMLDQAAIDAVRRWHFSPGRDRDGNPVRVLVRVPLQFTLR